MAQHVRHADRAQHERVVVKFTREDLLWRGRLADVDVPLQQDHARVVGPTILDMLVRHETEFDEEPVVYWSQREPRDFIERNHAKRAAGHPFRAGLVSGGRVVATDGDFVRVEKVSSVSIGAYAFRLAVGALGSVNEAHRAISTRAAAAWSADLVRSRSLYDAIKAAPDGMLTEDADVAALRPAGSVSDQIETNILREACTLLGVDPDLPIRRAPGRPRQSQPGDTEAGDFIAVTVVDGVLTGKTLASIAGIPAHTDLAVLTVLKLVALLHALVEGGAQLDADLLEAYLDAAAPQWRETAAGEGQADSSTSTDDPYTVLGVNRSMTFEDITKAYRRAMQAMHPDKGACPPWFAQVAGQAYRRIKAEMAGSHEE